MRKLHLSLEETQDDCRRLCAEQSWIPEELFTAAQLSPTPENTHDPKRFGLTEANCRPEMPAVLQKASNLGTLSQRRMCSFTKAPVTFISACKPKGRSRKTMRWSGQLAGVVFPQQSKE